jgi:hypothetical protein
MAVGCGASCAKLMLVIVNIIFILTGLVLIAIGIWLIADPDILKIVKFVVTDEWRLFRSAGILLITMGAFVLVVSVLGFVGTLTESKIILTIYIVLLVVVFAGECSGGIIAIVYKDKIRDKIDDALTNSLNGLAKSDNKTDPYYSSFTESDNKTNCRASEVGATWDYVQVMFDCCGVHDGGASGYETSQVQLNQICPMLNLPGNRPQTCCKPIDDDMDPIDSDDQKKYVDDFDCSIVVNRGCSDALMQWIEKYAPALVGIGMGFGMFQLVVIIFAVCLCQHTNRKKHELLNNSS